MSESVHEKRAMAIMAHPDDADFTCAGTLANWIDDGWHVTYVMCTNGDKGTNDPAISAEQMAATRAREAKAAAKVLGVQSCVFLDHPDGELEMTMAFRRELTSVIREHRPRAIFTHDPWRHYQIHPDHRAVGFTALDAIAAARDRLYFPEHIAIGLQPQRVKEAYLWAPESANHWIDISATFGRKLAALRTHDSQVGNMADLEERLLHWAELAGQSQGLALAEAYRRLDLP